MSANKFRIKRDDTVKVIAGAHKGETGRVVRVIPETGRVVVEGVNLVKRHQKPVGERPGGIVQKEASIHISNVALFDAAQGRTVKVGFKTDEAGTKIRVDRKTGNPVG
jgi:large subunit ribosomal protein L24